MTKSTPKTSNIYWPVVAIYLIFVFSNPSFYFNYTYDGYSTLAYFFLLLSLITWQSARDNIEMQNVWIIALLLFFSFFTKETYIITALLFFIVIYFYPSYANITQQKVHKKFVFIIIILIIFMFSYNVIVGSPWAKLGSNNNYPYHIDLNPYSIGKVFFTYAISGINFSGLLIFIITMICSRKNRLFGLFLFLLGLSVILPYSILPNHVYPAYYAWLVVPLSYGSILLLDQDSFKLFKKYSAIFIVFILIISAGFSLEYYEMKDYKNNSWLLQQESINRNILEGLPKIKDIVAPSDRVLLAGLYMPFHPFETNPSIPFRRDFIGDYFNDESLNWTVVTADVNKNVTNVNNIKYVSFRFVNILDYDRIMIFSSRGILIDELNRQDVENLFLWNEKDTKLKRVLSTLMNSNGDWPTLLMFGRNYIINRNIENADLYIDPVVRLTQGQNGWALLYKGKILEIQNKNEQAKNLFDKALEVSGDDLELKKEVTESFKYSPAVESRNF